MFKKNLLFLICISLANHLDASALILYEETIALEYVPENATVVHDGVIYGDEYEVIVRLSTAKTVSPGNLCQLELTIECSDYQDPNQCPRSYIRDTSIMLIMDDSQMRLTDIPSQTGYTVLKETDRGLHRLHDTSPEWKRNAQIAGAVFHSVADLIMALSLAESISLIADITQCVVDMTEAFAAESLDPKTALEFEQKFDMFTIQDFSLYDNESPILDTKFTRRTYDIPVVFEALEPHVFRIVIRNVSIQKDRQMGPGSWGLRGRAIVLDVAQLLSMTAPVASVAETSGGAAMAATPLPDKVPWEVIHTGESVMEFIDARIDLARQTGKPVVINFWATWCAYCKKLDKTVWNQPEVVRESLRYITIKVDATKPDDDDMMAVKERFRVPGLPTLAFIDSQGNIQFGKSFSGYKGPEEILARMRSIE